MLRSITPAGIFGTGDDHGTPEEAFDTAAVYLA
jgi:hypothetical protein